MRVCLFSTLFDFGVFPSCVAHNFNISATSFLKLLPPPNFFYENTTTFHHKWDYRSRRTHLTKEGVSQGCPLSPLFASLVVAHLLEPIDSRHSFTNELQRNSPLAIQVMMDLVASHTSLAMLMTFPHVSTSTTYHFSAQHSKPPALLLAAS